MRSLFGRTLVALTAACALASLAAPSALAINTNLWNELPPNESERAITESKSVTSEGTEWILEDQKAQGGALRDTCVFSGKGTVEPGGKGTVTEVKLTGCKFVTGKTGACEHKEGEAPTAAALHLPWKTQLVTGGGGKALNEPQSGTGGEPGFKIECKVAFIGKIKDECTGRTGLIGLVTNSLGGGGITEEIETFKESTKLSCSSGGTGAGLIQTKANVKFSTGEAKLRI